MTQETSVATPGHASRSVLGVVVGRGCREGGLGGVDGVTVDLRQTPVPSLDVRRRDWCGDGDRRNKPPILYSSILFSSPAYLRRVPSFLTRFLPSGIPSPPGLRHGPPIWRSWGRVKRSRPRLPGGLKTSGRRFRSRVSPFPLKSETCP